MTVPTRSELLRDGEYFATELVRRLEALQRREGDGRVRSNWQQASRLTRRVRAVLRDELALEARRRRLEQVRQAARA